MTPKEFKEYILKHMTAEEALEKLLAAPLLTYEKLKFPSKEESIHPQLLIAFAALDLGWQIAVEKREGEMRGIAVGTEEYLQSIYPKDFPDKSK